MPHSTSVARQTLSPNQLTLIEGTAGWRDNSARAETRRSQALKRKRALQQEVDALRDDVAAEKEILASIIQAQETALSEIAALAVQKPMAIDELADELWMLMGTDHPHNISIRVGYKDIENLIMRLRRNGLHSVAEQLKKPLKKPPAPYPTHVTQRAQRQRAKGSPCG